MRDKWSTFFGLFVYVIAITISEFFYVTVCNGWQSRIIGMLSGVLIYMCFTSESRVMSKVIQQKTKSLRNLLNEIKDS